MAWIIGAVCALVVALAAYWKQSLTLSGAIAAVVMGTIYYGAGNIVWFGILLVFFISSSLLSKFHQKRKAELEKSYAKTGRRDAGQVLANGGIGMVLCILNAIWPYPGWVYAFVGVMAGVTADTWATEWGSLSKKPPRSVLNGRILPAGTSGGVSVLGSTAAAVGGMMIGVFAWLFQSWTGLSGQWLVYLTAYILLGLVGGLVGSFVDSFLGASVQVMYKCQICNKEVEVLEHCGQPTQYVRGLRLMNNDAVNILSSIAAALGAWGLASLLQLGV
ncbi:DUF92 domain-containing protein [Paenibacillus pini]|uniref:DUF92 domain-containing protein n=1 Tax=Paenibacillus pini JCM 16418 TaxID=1236976 RepID=W7YG04_9BACL|nr:DUF92 domain-containing protein [Paenibacillus pini]GAF06468.1 hypothetical protein JCM16418_424 [Paenibacillus pini JCM 16418]